MRGDQLMGEAALEILDERIRAARKNVSNARRGDPDSVHDLRVAVRKIRVVLAILRETILDQHVAQKHERTLTHLFAALGDVRDHDVTAERTIAMASRDERPALTKTLAKRRRRAQKRLRAVMRGSDPVRVLQKLQHRVMREVASNAPDGEGALVRHHAGSVLLRRFEAVLAFENQVPGSNDAMHRLRVATKALRYAIDFFRDALGPPAETLDRILARAQDELGAIHDEAVAQSLAERASRVRPPRSSGVNHRLDASFAKTWTQLACGELATSLLHAIETLLVSGRPTPRPPV